MISDELKKQSLYGLKITDFTSFNSTAEYQRYKLSVERLTKEFEKQCYEEIKAIAKKNNPDFKLKENLCNYGRKNYEEFFAEAFANSQLGKPNELGKAMEEWLKGKGY